MQLYYYTTLYCSASDEEILIWFKQLILPNIENIENKIIKENSHVRFSNWE